MMETTTLLLLSLSAFMFGIGLYGLISKRNMIRMLLAAEVNFNAALLALLAFASSSPSADAASIGGITALLAIGIAAADVGMLVSIAILMYHLRRRLDVYELKESKG
jgi:NADH-quinone oxidoreductase subunit K